MPNGIAVKLKKFIALALSLFLFMPLCSGCSNQNGANTEAVNSAKKLMLLMQK